MQLLLKALALGSGLIVSVSIAMAQPTSSGQQAAPSATVAANAAIRAHDAKAERAKKRRPKLSGEVLNPPLGEADIEAASCSVKEVLVPWEEVWTAQPVFTKMSTGDAGNLELAVAYSGTQYSSLRLVGTRPRTEALKKRYAEWQLIGIWGCPCGANDMQCPTVFIEETLQKTVFARRVDGVCRGRAGVGLISNQRIKPVANSKLSCRPIADG